MNETHIQPSQKEIEFEGRFKNYLKRFQKPLPARNEVIGWKLGKSWERVTDGNSVWIAPVSDKEDYSYKKDWYRIGGTQFIFDDDRLISVIDPFHDVHLTADKSGHVERITTHLATETILTQKILYDESKTPAPIGVINEKFQLQDKDNPNGLGSAVLRNGKVVIQNQGTYTMFAPQLPAWQQED